MPSGALPQLRSTAPTLPLLSPVLGRGVRAYLPVTSSPSPQLTSLSDRYVSHFETEGPHVLLYFDSVSRGWGGGAGDRGGHRGAGFPELGLRGFPTGSRR